MNDYLNLFQRQPLYYNHHQAVLHNGVTNDNLLNNFFYITGYSTSDAGEKFIASLEGKELPVYGVQYHPEKNSFEWKVNADHNIYAVELE